MPKRFGGFGKIGTLPKWAINIINMALNILKKQTSFSIEFLIEATVDIPWGMNIVEKIYISVKDGHS
jgi:hypothetical protein